LQAASFLIKGDGGEDHVAELWMEENEANE